MPVLLAGPTRASSVEIVPENPFATGGARKWLSFGGPFTPAPAEDVEALLEAFRELGGLRRPSEDQIARLARRVGPLGVDHTGFPAGRRTLFRWPALEGVEDWGRVGRAVVTILRVARAEKHGKRMSREDYEFLRSFCVDMRAGMSHWLLDRLELLPAVRFPQGTAQERARRVAEGLPVGRVVVGEKVEKAIVDPMQRGFLSGVLSWWLTAAGLTPSFALGWGGTPAMFRYIPGDPRRAELDRILPVGIPASPAEKGVDRRKSRRRKPPASGWEGTERRRPRGRRTIASGVTWQVEGHAPRIVSVGCWFALGAQLAHEVQRITEGRGRRARRQPERCGYCEELFPLAKGDKRRREGHTPCCGSPACKREKNRESQRRWRARHAGA